MTHKCLAPRAGLEPTTNRLTADCSTIELSGINEIVNTDTIIYCNSFVKTFEDLLCG
jgi:hypothetical protein